MPTAPPPRIGSAIDAGLVAYVRSGGSWPAEADAIRTHLDGTDCAHDGERVEHRRSGFLGDVPAGVVDELCAECGALLAEAVR